MDDLHIGTQSVRFDAPPSILSFAAIGGKKEQEGPLASYFDFLYSDTTPGMQLYTANFLSPRTGKGGAQYQEGGAVCLETQFYPDAIHHANFPSPVLRAGGVYRETTILRFA